MKRLFLVVAATIAAVTFGMIKAGNLPHVFAQAAKAVERTTVMITRKPVRVIGDDPYSNFTGVAVDESRGQVFLSNDSDAKGASIETYNVDFPASQSDRITEPLHIISGRKAQLGDICSITVSPEFGEIFKVNGDGNGDVGVYPMDSNGDVAPIRQLPTSHGAWGIYLEPKYDEIYVAIEHVNRVEVYPRTANLTTTFTRFIQGPNTQLADPHGIYANVDRNEIYVVNHGHWHFTPPGDTYLQEGSIPPELVGKRKSYSDVIRPLLPSTGKFLPPSINVYSRTANGDVKPLRVIEGPKVGLDIPLGLTYDAVNNQIVIANAGNDSVIFFDVNSNGDAAPVRILKGSKTGLSGPSAVGIDGKRNEIWVANWNNHTATVYPRNVNGNVAPLRIIRAAPKGTEAPGFGRPGTVAFDPVRKQILVPN